MSDPSPQDVADAMTATLRELKVVSARIDHVMAGFWLVQIALALLIGAATLYLLRRSVSEYASR